jgi:hypothetical protein
LQDYSICNNARLISTQLLLQAFDPNEWCLKNGLLSGGLNPRPLSHESSALTTRPRLIRDLKIKTHFDSIKLESISSSLVTSKVAKSKDGRPNPVAFNFKIKSRKVFGNPSRSDLFKFGMSDKKTQPKVDNKYERMQH